MAINPNDILEIVPVMNWLGEQCLNTWHYRVDILVASPSIGAIAAAWWNDVKTVYRSLAPSTGSSYFLSVRIKGIMTAVDDYAEFAIPTAEQSGTRTSETGDPMPPFVAAASRFTVGTRLTRPGQKRVPFLYEGDNNQGYLGAGFTTAFEAWAAHMSQPLVLGAPAAATEITPMVARVGTTGLYVAGQPITGHVLNPLITSQNTRKIGRGI